MMFLFPKKSKFIKSFSAKKLTAKTVAKVKSNIYGNISLIANETGKITNFQIESIRRFLRRFLKKKAQIFFRMFPNTPITKKPNDIRLGRGKGNLKYWACLVKKGTTLVEIRSFDDVLTKKSLLASQIKLSTKTFTFNRQLRWIL